MYNILSLSPSSVSLLNIDSFPTETSEIQELYYKA